MAASPSLRFLSLTLPVMLAASACQRDPLEYSPDELQALLDDGELDLPDTPITRAQLAEDGGVAGAGGSGGRGGMDGSGGSGGSSVDGGVGSDGPGGRGGSGGVGTGGRGGSIGPDGGPIGGSDGGPDAITSPTAMWNFDDCNEFRTNLEDNTFNGFTAFRTVRAACVPGIEGQGISLPNAQDLVYAPDQPTFTFERGVTVAAWVNPTKVTGLRTIFRKRDGLTSAMALMLVDKHWVFVVSRHKALPVAVIAPAKAGVFTHVAGTYDGDQIKLYLNGEKVAGGTARGTIENGEGPLLMGNDGFQRRFEGTLDKVWFAREAATPATILSLQCLRRPPSLKLIPAASDPVPAARPWSRTWPSPTTTTRRAARSSSTCSTTGYPRASPCSPASSSSRCPAVRPCATR
jgi:Concanavalin A-like lectin/glucanases superfamily